MHSGPTSPNGISHQTCFPAGFTFMCDINSYIKPSNTFYESVLVELTFQKSNLNEGYVTKWEWDFCPTSGKKIELLHQSTEAAIYLKSFFKINQARWQNKKEFRKLLKSWSVILARLCIFTTIYNSCVCSFQAFFTCIFWNLLLYLFIWGPSCRVRIL